MTTQRTGARLAAVLAVLLASSAASAQKKVTVTVAKDGPHHAKVTLSTGAFCGVDGAPLKKVEEPIPIITTRPHTVKCASSANGKNASETAIPNDFLGKMSVTGSVPDDAKKGTKAKLTIKLADSSGNGVEDVPLTAKADGATLGPIKDDGGGVYTTEATYAQGTKSFKLHVEVAGADPIDNIVVPIDVPQPVAPPPPPSRPTNEAAPPPPALPPEKPRANHIEIGVMGGFAAGPVAGPNAKVELGASHDFTHVGVAAFVRGAYEKYTRDNGAAGTSDEQIFALELPIMLRLFVSKTWFPYVAVVPGIAFDGLVFEGLPGRDVIDAPTIAGLGGAQLRLGPAGVFVEAGGRFGSADHQTGEAPLKLPVFQAALGARLAL